MQISYSTILLIVGLFYVAICVGCGSTRSDFNKGQITDDEGNPFDLWQHVEKSPATVLLFTRTDCPISNRYAPTVSALYNTYQPRGVDFFLFYINPQENPTTIRQHLRDFQYPCRGIHDPRHALVKLTGATVTPEAIVFDSQRNIVYRGRIDDLYVKFGQARDTATTHELADALDAVLAGKPVAEPVTKAVGCYIGDLEQ